MRLIYFVFIFLGVAFQAAAYTGCLVPGASERLQNYCLQNALSEGVVDYQQLQLVDTRLRLQGYKNGLGVLGAKDVRKPKTYAVVQPYVGYEENINGGNPAKPIIFQFGVFDDPSLYRKSGLIYGLGIGFGGRYLYGEGKYVNYSLGNEFGYSPKHALSTTKSVGSLCSYNHIQGWWYVDACTNASRTLKYLSGETHQNFSLTAARIVSGANGSSREIKLGYNQYFSEIYVQRQLKFGIDSMFASGNFLGIDATFGEAIPGHLITRYALAGRATAHFGGKPITITVSYKQSDGGNLLGVVRDEQNTSLLLSYPLWGTVSASIGYTQTQSNVDYFDDAYPSFGLQLAGFQF
tara:strand:- start:371 stop:1420 length:1050 start_codon:yes stop_codon:yes gene_type:complete